MKKIMTLLLIPFLFSCEENIEWKVKDSDPVLVVQGAVTNENKQHYVALTTTQSYFDNSSPKGVSGATVFISDGEKRHHFMEVAEYPGLYLSEETFAGEVGATFFLKISLKTPIEGDSVFTASTQILPPYPIDSLSYHLYEEPANIVFNYESRIFFTVYGHEYEQQGNYYLLNVLKNNSALTDNIQDMKIWDDKWFNGRYDVTTGDFGFFEPIEQGDTITLEIRSIEKAYQEFLTNIKTEVDGRDPFGFLGAPANVQGNISNGALGYFAGYASSKKSIIIK